MDVFFEKWRGRCVDGSAVADTITETRTKREPRRKRSVRLIALMLLLSCIVLRPFATLPYF